MTDLGLVGVAIIAVMAFGGAFLTTQRGVLGLPVADSWADLSGAFTGAAAVFSALAVIGILLTLRLQARDGAVQAENFQRTVDAQAEAITHLGNAAKALSAQVAAATEAASAAGRQCDLAQKRLDLDQANRQIDLLYRHLDRFMATPRPDPALTRALTEPISDQGQAVWRERLGESWRHNLLMVLTTALQLRKGRTDDDPLLGEINAAVDEIRLGLSTGERCALALAELTPASSLHKDYKPSRLASALKATKLMPNFSKNSDLLRAYYKA